METTSNRLDLIVIPGSFGVARLDHGEPIPAWAVTGDFWCIAGTRDETSVVCPDSVMPEDVPSERGFSCLKVAGPLDFSLTGIMAALAGPLAEAGISIFAISTYDTDYLLVRTANLDHAIMVLEQAGHRIIS